MTNQKLYPFSTSKHAHDIEFYYNRLSCRLYDMESGEIESTPEERYKLAEYIHGELLELYEKMFEGNGYVVYLTGKQIGLAKEIVAWASETRANTMIRSGKTRYLQYC